MKTSEERIVLLHKRAEELEQRRNRSKMALWGSTSAGLMILLLAVALHFAGDVHVIADARFTASSMLNESAGGYVLTAVVSFVAAVIITVICIRSQRKKTKPPGQDERKKDIDQT